MGQSKKRKIKEGKCSGRPFKGGGVVARIGEPWLPPKSNLWLPLIAPGVLVFTGEPHKPTPTLPPEIPKGDSYGA